jgi:Tol biopolymer transport system component
MRTFTLAVFLLLTLLAPSAQSPLNHLPSQNLIAANAFTSPCSEQTCACHDDQPHFVGACKVTWIYRYQPDTTLVSPPLPVKLTQLTDWRAEARDPAWCGKDGLYYAATSSSGEWNLWSTSAKQWQPDQREYEPFIPKQAPAVVNGQYGGCALAYVSNAYGDGQGPFQIWAEIDGTDQQITTGDGDKLWPSWSPDGDWLVFSWKRAGNWDLWMIHRDGTSLHQLTSTSYDERFPVFSPDGDWIAYSSNQSGHDELWRMKVDGSAFQRITSGPGNKIEPSYSPDGSKIAFASDRTGNWNIWLTDLEGSLLTPVTQDSFEDQQPAWSPDGKTIAFDSNRSGHSEIWTAEILPVETVERIAFTRGKDSQQEIYLIDADGSHEFQLTHNDVWDGEVAWSPSGYRLAFVRAIPKREYATHEVGYLAKDQLWVINTDGSAPRLLLSSELYQRAGTSQEASGLWLPEGLIHLQWTSDESRLFAEGIAWVTSDAIWSVNLDRSNPKLFDAGNDLQMTAPGHLFYFQHNYYPDGAHNEFYLMDRDGHEIRSFRELHDFYPKISPDESKLIFSVGPKNERGFKEGVYLWELNTGKKTKLPEQIQLGSELEWSPDSKQLVYVNERDSNQEIYVLNLEKQIERRLTNNPAADYSPRWSPDGKQIAFVSERDGNPEIYVMDADGANLTRLTNSPEPDLDPRWSPKPVPRLLGFEAAWPVYRNFKYGGFALQYPPDWTLGPEPFNHDGRSFIAPYEAARVSAFVFNLALDGSNPKGQQTLDKYVSWILADLPREHRDFIQTA